MTKRAPNVANVWWLPGETLYCLHCAGGIHPVKLDNGKNLYSIHWSTEENRGAYPADVLEENLPHFLKYKFCSQDCAQTWAFPDGVIPDYHEEAEKIIKQTRELPKTRLRVGGFHLGMEIQAAAILLNFYTGQHFKAHPHRGYPDAWVLKNTSDGDSPSNAFIFRTPRKSQKVAEIFMQSGLLATVFGQKFSCPESIPDHLGIPVYLQDSFPFYEKIVGMGPWQSRRFYQYRNHHFEEFIALGDCDRVHHARGLIETNAIYINSLNHQLLQ